MCVYNVCAYRNTIVYSLSVYIFRVNGANMKMHIRRDSNSTRICLGLCISIDLAERIVHVDIKGCCYE